MIRAITTDELQSMRRGNADFLLLDVLPGAQFHDEHIEGARNIPLGSPDFLQAVGRAAGSTSRRIVVYCAGEGCAAAEQAARQLADAGYVDVMTYAGGIASWRQHGAHVQTGDTDSNGGRHFPAASSPKAISREATMSSRPFHPDIKTLRERARMHIQQGAVTPGYLADRTVVVEMLNAALATELVCVLRYKRHYFMAQGINSKSLAAEFLEHATEEQGHADQLAARIVQLGGEPDFSPEGLARRSHAEYAEGEDLNDMIHENLVAERIAIDSYGSMIRYLGNDDPTTRRMLEEILASEERHAEELANLMKEMAPAQGG